MDLAVFWVPVSATGAGLGSSCRGYWQERYSCTFAFPTDDSIGLAHARFTDDAVKGTFGTDIYARMFSGAGGGCQKVGKTDVFDRHCHRFCFSQDHLHLVLLRRPPTFSTAAGPKACPLMGMCPSLTALFPQPAKTPVLVGSGSEQRWIDDRTSSQLS